MLVLAVPVPVVVALPFEVTVEALLAVPVESGGEEVVDATAGIAIVMVMPAVLHKF